MDGTTPNAQSPNYLIDFIPTTGNHNQSLHPFIPNCILSGPKSQILVMGLNFGSNQTRKDFIKALL